jgi:hypothetical protein
MRRRYPASAPMHDPRTPEITTWLESLPARERLATMHAMSIAFPLLQKSADWMPRTATARGALKPTAQELADILISTREISLRLKRELARPAYGREAGDGLRGGGRRWRAGAYGD